MHILLSDASDSVQELQLLSGLDCRAPICKLDVVGAYEHLQS